MSEKKGAAPTGRPDDSAARRTHWRGAAAPLSVWQQAIDAELVSAHLGVAHNDAPFEDAQKAIHELICWHIDVATNPATNGGQRLTDAKPATSELVMDVRCEGCGYMTHHREHMGCVRAAKQHTHPAPIVPDEKPLPDLMMASYHEAIGWNACRAAMLAAK